MLCNVMFDEDNQKYTFTLWRDHQKIVHEFEGFSVMINEFFETIINGVSSVKLHIIPESILEPEQREKIDGPAFNGDLYYICAKPFYGDDILIWLSKEEFDILQPMMNTIENGLDEDKND